MSERVDGTDCNGHAGLAAELRAFAITALDRLEPVLDRIRPEAGSAPDGMPGACAVCPICALIATLRGERPELATRLAEQAAGLLAVLRSALDEGAGTAPADSAAAQPSQPTRPVQRIPVDRT